MGLEGTEDTDQQRPYTTGPTRFKLHLRSSSGRYPLLYINPSSRFMWYRNKPYFRVGDSRTSWSTPTVESRLGATRVPVLSPPGESDPT